MFTANKLSRSSVANGGFGDPDITPKPLRISKRDQAGTSNTGTANSSLSIPKSQTQRNLQALAPGKRFLTRINSTQLDLSQQDLAAPTSQWARRNTFLHVHKQRQSDPIETNTAVSIGFLPFDPPARSRSSCPTMDQLGRSSDASNAATVVRSASTRAFTTGDYKMPNLLSPVREISSSPSASSTLRTGHRRAVTNAEAFYKDLDNFKSLSLQKLRKQRSTKNSLMSRMMSGLTNRSHVSHIASWGGIDAKQAPQRHISPASPSRKCEDMEASRQSSSSTRTDTSCGRDLHYALSDFPTPPTSNATSLSTAGSLKSRYSIKPKRIRELCQPADAVLMGAELTLTPEYDQLSFEKERSMLVSLDIKGTTNSTSSIQDVWSQHTGLDIVVVIDNS